MTISIVSEAGNFVFDVSGSATAPGTHVIGYSNHGGSNQTFSVKDNRIYSINSGLVLDADLNNGCIIIEKKSKSINQLWFFHDDGSIRNCHNQCITLMLTNGKQGDLYLQPWSGSSYQKWRVVTTPMQ